MIDETDFYEIESRDEQLELLIGYAVLAPSTHNTQPWFFRITPEGIEVYADYARRLPLLDPADRELLMSVGAAIANLRVAAAHFGFETSVLHQVRPEESLPVALIPIRETCAPDPRLASLFPSIKRRHTNRARFSGNPLQSAERQALFDLMSEFPRFLRLVLPTDRERAAELVEAGDRAQMRRPAFRGELAACMPPSLQRWIIEHFDAGGLIALEDADLLDSASLLLVVTADDDRPSLVRAGEVLERVLLTLTQLGLQYSFMNQPIAVEDLRGRFWTLLGDTPPPQLLLRIGKGPAVRRATPRRAVESVLAR